MTQPAIDIHDLVAQMGGEVVEIRPFNRGEGNMEDKARAELARLEGLFREHMSNAQKADDASQQSRAGARECKGAIETLRRLLEPEPEPVVPEDED